ncbi:hypothetical protein ABZP36_010626 [Zizania latifolia]
MRVVRAIRWVDVIDTLREHLQVSYIGTSLLVLTAICPHVVALKFVERLSTTLIAITFPLVGRHALVEAVEACAQALDPVPSHTASPTECWQSHAQATRSHDQAIGALVEAIGVCAQALDPTPSDVSPPPPSIA